MTIAHAHLRPHWRSRLRLRLRNGRLAMLLGGSLLGLWLLLALFAPWLAPYDPIYQNTDRKSVV